MNTPPSFQQSTWILCLFFPLFASIIGRSVFGVAPAPEQSRGLAIKEDLVNFQQCASVLYVAAHPDDENTQLITYFSLGRGYRTAYLSVTRGDGGQNVLGSEFGDELGVIRTQELLAARKVDGGRQFFTRAIDFGFSKDPNETLRIWDRQAVLGDVVRVIREFRPDVIITRFSPEPSRTHGHHTASAMLALEAFRLAGDPTAFPEQLKDLQPWQPKRIVQNGRQGGGGGTPDTSKPGSISFDISGTDPVSGESFDGIAAKSRSMHQSQGFASFAGFGGRAAAPRMESFQPLGGEAATKDVFDGIDTTWSRFKGGEAIANLTGETIAKFNAEDPAASIPALLEIRSKLASLPADPIVDEKRAQLNRIIIACAGVEVRTRIANAEVTPGEAMRLELGAIARSPAAVRWIGVRFPATDQNVTQDVGLTSAEFATIQRSETLPLNTPLTQPYWLRESGADGIYTVRDTNLIGMPENPPAFPVEYLFEIGGQKFVVHDEPVHFSAGKDSAEQAQQLVVIPPVSLAFKSGVRLFSPLSERAVEVEVIASRPDVAGTLSLNVPDGWSVSPASQPFQLKSSGERMVLSFMVKAPAAGRPVDFTASAEVHGRTFNTGRVDIRYDHISHQVLQPPARMRAVSVEMQTRGHRIGYIPGAGDSVAADLGEMGFEVTPLTGADLTSEKLGGLDAVVVGIRAFNVRKDLDAGLPALFAFAEAGGTVVVQYNRPDGIQTSRLTPFELKLSGDRVTDENAAMTFLAPDHPVLNSPNKITAADFEGWVQERGIYFPNQWDEHFVPLLACSDPGEAPMKGGLLVAPYGKGRFIYTGLAWFRQLPAGVPGAYRLFANMVAPSE
ncbi:MAG: PIG-L family deacetylase [Phycisphaerales bacterium]